jgi:hypothetical protein
MSSARKNCQLAVAHILPSLNALTRAALLVTMSGGTISLVRRITTCLVLVALAGIYAMPLAAALSPNAMDCCSAGMCPRPGRAMSHHQTHEEMPDCDGMGAPAGSMRKCDMGARNTQKVSAVNVGLFVLTAPMRIVRSAMHVPVLAQAPQTEYTVSQIPDTPPPRISLS